STMRSTIHRKRGWRPSNSSAFTDSSASARIGECTVLADSRVARSRTFYHARHRSRPDPSLDGFLRRHNDEGMLQRYDRLLAPEQREQQRRFHLEIDGHGYLVLRALSRVLRRDTPQWNPRSGRSLQTPAGKAGCRFI